MENSHVELAHYLCGCDSVEVHTLITLMRSRLSPRSREIATRYPAPESIPQPGSEERRELANSVVSLLRWFGSNSLAYGARLVFGKEAGTGYSRILRDVAKIMNGHLKRRERMDLPRLATVAQWEEIIVNLVITRVYKEMSSEEIAQMLREAGLNEDAARAAAKKFGPGMGAIAFPVLVNLLGKKTVTVVLEQLLVAVTYRFVGKEAAQTLAKRFMIIIAKRSWARLVAVVGWILLGIDILLFATSPATRITLPSIAAISLFRIRHRLQDAEVP
ncbi:MAG: hypothetical protein NTX87_03750 [Planctomycetota bacterium]|nr:hypothetical protein [Planctomycetota bacterium]